MPLLYYHKPCQKESPRLEPHTLSAGGISIDEQEVGSMGKVRTYFKNAVILTVTGLALRAAGMFFRIYIAARIGAEGMGLYPAHLHHLQPVHHLCHGGRVGGGHPPWQR